MSTLLQKVETSNALAGDPFKLADMSGTCKFSDTGWHSPKCLVDTILHDLLYRCLKAAEFPGGRPQGKLWSHISQTLKATVDIFMTRW